MLQAKNIQKSYGSKLNKQNVLQGIDMHIEKGEFVTIMGASGSGKTTLLNVLSSIDQVSHGSIRIDGEPLTKMNGRKLANFRKHHLGFIFQEYHLLDTLTVKENILLPLTVQKLPGHEAQERFKEVASELDIVDIKDKYPNEISGGQKQRTSAARAFIHEPLLVFADEPTGALDSKSASDLLNKLYALHKQHETTVLMVTHDPSAASYSSRVIFIKDGRIYSQLNKGDGTRKDFLADILKTQAVLGGIHDAF